MLGEVVLLCEIITQGAKASTGTFHPKAEFNALVRQGLVREIGVGQSIQCNDCDEPHDAEIVFEREQYSYFCPEIGFAPVERPNLSGVRSDLQVLTSQIGDALGCKHLKEHQSAARHGVSGLWILSR